MDMDVLETISKYNKNHAKDGKFASSGGGGGGGGGGRAGVRETSHIKDGTKLGSKLSIPVTAHSVSHDSSSFGVKLGKKNIGEVYRQNRGSGSGSGKWRASPSSRQGTTTSRRKLAEKTFATHKEAVRSLVNHAVAPK